MIHMIIFLYGSDTFRAQKKINDLEAKFIAEVDPTGSSVIRLDSIRLTIDELGKVFRPLSLFVKRRFIILRNPLSNLNKEFIEELENFLEKEKDNDNILVIYEPGFVEKKFGGKQLIMKPGPDDKTIPLNKVEKKLYDRLKKSQFTQYFGHLAPSELSRYLITLATQSSVTLSLPLAQLIIRLVGNDLWALSQEIEKLCAYALAQTKGSEAIITEVDIKKLVTQSVNESIFALTDALGSRQEQVAIKLLTDQFNNGIHSSYILTMILWQFKTLASVRQALDSGQSSKELQKLLGLHPYVLEKSINQVRKFNLPSLQKIIDRLIEIDYKSKSGQGTVEELLPVALVSKL